jgi:hypothetical protein
MIRSMDEEVEPGALRITEDDEVEVFDGKKWWPYRNLPPGDLDTILRNDPENGYTIKNGNPPHSGG